MENISKTEEEFNRKLDEVKKASKTGLYGANDKEIVIYDKLLELQSQINKLSDKTKRIVKDDIPGNGLHE